MSPATDSVPAEQGGVFLFAMRVTGFCDTPHSPWSGVLWILIWILAVAIAACTTGTRKEETNHLNNKKNNL